MKRTIAVPVTITLILTITFACGTAPEPGTQDAGRREVARTYRVDTTTTCRAGGLRSTEKGPSTVLFTDRAITLGADDEALAGIPLPFFMRGGFITVPPVTIATDEIYGEIDLKGVEGELAGDRLSISYKFHALDVACTVSGSGHQL